MSELTYPLAPQGAYPTVLGEGWHTGLPAVIIRLAGCSVGCAFCDTDYSVSSRATAEQIAEMVAARYLGAMEWIWVSGGEPSDYDLAPLLWALRSRIPGCKIALATAGERPLLRLAYGFDFVSVSPHRPERWVQTVCDQVNLVPGLSGRHLVDFLDVIEREQIEKIVPKLFVTPCAGKPETLAECLRWVNARPGWRLGVQAHLQWWLA